MANNAQINFITSQATELIDKYVQSNIIEPQKEKYQEFIPLVTKKVEAVCNEWLKEMQKHSLEEKFFISITPSFTTNEAGMELLMKIFKDATGCTFKAVKKEDDECLLVPNLLGLGIFPKSRFQIKANIYWTPTNRFVYPEFKAKHYQYDPSSLGKGLLKAAKEGQDTDVKITCKEGEIKIIPVHSLILKNRSEYFNCMLSNEFEEAKGTINLPHSADAVSYMIQFIYEEQLDSSAANNLPNLIECLEMAHEYQMPNFFDHCTDLINDYLKARKELSADEIATLINLCDLYKLNEEFYLACLQGAEKIDGFDWSQVNPMLYIDLLFIADHNRLEKVKQQIKIADNVLKEHSNKNSESQIQINDLNV